MYGPSPCVRFVFRVLARREPMSPKGTTLSFLLSAMSVRCSAKCQHAALNWFMELYSHESFGCAYPVQQCDVSLQPWSAEGEGQQHAALGP